MSEEKGEYKTGEEKRVLVFRNMHNKENPYALVSKECLDDSRLSWKARGLLAYLLGKPDTWEVVSEHLKKQASDGARSLRSGLLELQFFGYLEKFIEKDKGKFKQFGYNIYESSQKPDATVLEYEKLKKKKMEDEKNRKISRNHPFLRFAQMENSTLVSNDIVNNELKHTCEKNGEDMCEKCEMLKKKIDLGIEYGFEFDVKNSKEMLKNLSELHKTEDPSEHKKVTQNERIVAMMQGSKDEYADKLADYPDRCRKPLNYFLHKWNFSPSSVPKKSKSKGGAFATWINGIDELVAISGERNFELVLDKTYDVWYNRSTDYKNVVDMPQKIKPLFTSCNNLVRQEITKKMQEEMKKTKEKVEEKKEFVSAEDGAKLLKQLQKSLKKGKEE